MKINISIQLKATFLLAVFALNTVVGFACAVGLNMGFNNAHHQDESAIIAVHQHVDELKHQHLNKPDQHHSHKKDGSGKDDCCNHSAIKLQKLDKNLTQNNKGSVAAGEFVAILNNPFALNNVKVFKVMSQKHIIRNFHPPPHDIRIAIRSFQI